MLCSNVFKPCNVMRGDLFILLFSSSSARTSSSTAVSIQSTNLFFLCAGFFLEMGKDTLWYSARTWNSWTKPTRYRRFFVYTDKNLHNILIYDRGVLETSYSLLFSLSSQIYLSISLIQFLSVSLVVLSLQTVRWRTAPLSVFHESPDFFMASPDFKGIWT